MDRNRVVAILVPMRADGLLAFSVMTSTALPSKRSQMRDTLRALLDRVVPWEETSASLCRAQGGASRGLPTPPLTVPPEQPDSGIQLLGHILNRETKDPSKWMFIFSSPHISTVHSFCVDVLCETYGSAVGEMECRYRNEM
ncbi:hypothetical protein TREES_T100011928 [Tupaia chinensis]|uniref:Uncharacterized protein n=1 Tax=Tupaia chinensis TaxID=246437 RepID=L9KT45_TUPCH|nr:hypothetical protein TREES_T100011928 [Tupaia chinensis]